MLSLSGSSNAYHPSQVSTFVIRFRTPLSNSSSVKAQNEIMMFQRDVRYITGNFHYQD